MPLVTLLSHTRYNNNNNNNFIIIIIIIIIIIYFVSRPEEYYLYDVIDYIYRMMRREFKHYTIPKQLYK